MASIAEQYTQTPTYESLLEMLKIYLNRRDVDTIEAMPFFINAAEKTILRTLRIPTLEKMVSFDTTDNTAGYIELPSDYVEMRFVWTDGDETPGTLERVPFDRILRGNPSLSGTSIVLNGDGGLMTTNDTYYYGNGDYNTGYWAINGNRMYFDKVSVDATVKMTYYYDVPELGPETQANPLLTLLPDAFLYMAVGEGWKFLMEPEKAAMWEQFAMSRVVQVQQQSDLAEFAGSPLTIGPI